MLHYYMHAVPWVDYHTVTIHTLEATCPLQNTVLLRRTTTTTIYTTTKYYCWSMTKRSYNTDNLKVKREVKQPRGTIGWGMATILLLYTTTTMRYCVDTYILPGTLLPTINTLSDSYNG